MKINKLNPLTRSGKKVIAYAFYEMFADPWKVKFDKLTY